MIRDVSISTHALTWSATSLVPSNVPDTRDFNSRTHVECDGCETMARNESYDFNSRTHVECDAQTRCAKYWVLQFQLTHSRGVRPKCPGRRGANDISTHALTWSATMMDSDGTTRRTHFNSRTHVECDLSITGRFFYVKNFNSRTHVECDMSWYGGMGYDY